MLAVAVWLPVLSLGCVINSTIRGASAPAGGGYLVPPAGQECKLGLKGAGNCHGAFSRADAHWVVVKSEDGRERWFSRDQIVYLEFSETDSSITLWEVGYFDRNVNDFDTDPHDNPTEVNFEVGDDVAHFSAGLGTDIGDQNSVVHVHFSGDLSEGGDLVVQWSPGGSGAEQFGVEIDGRQVAESRVRYGEGAPYTWHVEKFALPATEGKTHRITLTHLHGDGSSLDALRLMVPNPGAT